MRNGIQNINAAIMQEPRALAKTSGSDSSLHRHCSRSWLESGGLVVSAPILAPEVIWKNPVKSASSPEDSFIPACRDLYNLSGLYFGMLPASCDSNCTYLCSPSSVPFRNRPATLKDWSQDAPFGAWLCENVLDVRLAYRYCLFQWVSALATVFAASQLCRLALSWLPLDRIEMRLKE